MNGRIDVDQIDRNILRILSAYERLTPLQVWYELEEDTAGKTKPSVEQILQRLEFLSDRGFVEKLTGSEVSGNYSLSIYRLKASTALMGMR
ncbi:MAG: hypothetical protein GTN74_00600 [Proteobacteria bacterium]|nr:hypothetical protein [Pseudomonadota bacterium]NIS67513.1 hypothetical protein [Pseudomonadota bacterium]